jgi:hypothetical protein
MTSRDKLVSNMLEALEHANEWAFGDGRPVKDVEDAISGAKQFLAQAKPEVVCLCGSTRFFDTYIQEQWRLTLEGKIVFMIAICPPGGPKDHAGEAYGPETAALLDELHLRKIDLADEVRILNVGGYIGKSTRRELEYAISHGKFVSFLEPVGDEEGLK